MENYNQQNSAGRRFRVKNVPQSPLHTGEGEESYSVPSSCDTDTSCDNDTPNGAIQPSQPPPVEQDSPATPTNRPQAARLNKRNYKKVKWSVEEKRVILYCFAYSRYKGWGKEKGKVFPLRTVSREDTEHQCEKPELVNDPD